VHLPSRVARRAFDGILQRIPAGALSVRHLDGTQRTYGRGTPYFTIVIRHERAYSRLVSNPSLHFGECYVDGDIDIEGPLQQVARFGFDIRNAVRGSTLLRHLRPPWENTKRRQRAQMAHSYDVGNDFFQLWLDPSFTYTCAYFGNPDDTLETAQANKRAHVLRKLRLQPGQRVLDIGSGWGTALVEAAEEYGIHGVGVTLSREQLTHARELARKRGVADRVEFRLQNYLDVSGETFDAIYSIGMFEAVGRHNGHQYFRKVFALLRDGGLSVLHTITKQGMEGGQPWINKYIFPGAYVPAAYEVVRHLARHGFRIVHAENLRLHYAMTLEEVAPQVRRATRRGRGDVRRAVRADVEPVPARWRRFVPVRSTGPLPVHLHQGSEQRPPAHQRLHVRARPGRARASALMRRRPCRSVVRAQPPSAGREVVGDWQVEGGDRTQRVVSSRRVLTNTLLRKPALRSSPSLAPSSDAAMAAATA
jgi:cyclopropane-fatty-acyl-phospholipid synthase